MPFFASAAAGLYEEETKTYNLRKEGRKLTGEQMVEFWAKLMKDRPTASLEEGLAQDDQSSWQLLTKPVNEHCRPATPLMTTALRIEFDNVVASGMAPLAATSLFGRQP